jgi:hypothetical protein
VIFISNYRLEISKKRLAHYNFEDIEYCAAVFIRYWCTGANGEKEEFDPQLAQDIREIKSAVNGSKDFMDSLRSIVTQRLSTELPSSTTLNPTSAINRGATFSFKGFSALINSTNATSSIIDLSSAATPTNTVATPTSATAVGQPSITANFNSQFKQLVRTTISLGCGLSQPKEIRDLIIDIVEKIVEPCASFGWRKTEIDCFFDAINGGWTEVGALPQEFIELKRPSWDRLTAGIRLITLRLSNDLSAALAL